MFRPLQTSILSSPVDPFGSPPYWLSPSPASRFLRAPSTMDSKLFFLFILNSLFPPLTVLSFCKVRFTCQVIRRGWDVREFRQRIRGLETPNTIKRYVYLFHFCLNRMYHSLTLYIKSFQRSNFQSFRLLSSELPCTCPDPRKGLDISKFVCRSRSRASCPEPSSSRLFSNRKSVCVVYKAYLSHIKQINVTDRKRVSFLVTRDRYKQRFVKFVFYKG